MRRFDPPPPPPTSKQPVNQSLHGYKKADKGSYWNYPV